MFVRNIWKEVCKFVIVNHNIKIEFRFRKVLASDCGEDYYNINSTTTRLHKAMISEL